MPAPLIALVTDFGLQGPYLGQMRAVLHRLAPGVLVIDLLADAPVHNPKATAYLLPAYIQGFPTGTVFVCVVDPGVGSFAATPVIVQAGDYWFVGPDNGLFELIYRRLPNIRRWAITYDPAALSASFHGRDLYAPAAARIASGGLPDGAELPPAQPEDWPDDLSEIIYIDHFGNAMTGLRAAHANKSQLYDIKGVLVKNARTFSDLPPGTAFWYENANGLVEIAVNQGRADKVLGLAVGDALSLAA
jgi:hypothetical protein